MLLFSAYHLFSQKTVRYDLFVKDTMVAFAGKQRPAFAVNGQIPMPTLTFTEGDTALIYVHNELKENTSMHWHGLILPNQYDGVPYLTTAPIEPKTTHIYKFPLVQNGTYWYHSHTKLQEQSGMYGAFIIHKKEEPAMLEYAVVLSDWTNEKPYEVHRSLHNATDWYAIKKGSTQNYGQALLEGHFSTKLGNEWKRMLPMDVSDVYYERFLVNGKPENEATQFKAGDKVRLRIINGGSSSYFWLQYAGGKITVVANDGIEVQPVKVDRMIIAVAETYDIIVEIPENRAYELKITPEDRTKSASLFLGKGEKTSLPEMPKLRYFEGMKMMNDMMKMNGKMDDMGMKMSLQKMDMNTVMYPEIVGFAPNKHAKMEKMEGMNHEIPATKTLVTLNYGMLLATSKTTLPTAPIKEMRFELTGNMNRYVWSLDNKTVSETDKILIKKGENVRIILYNGSMMRHPMHLHGHFFRLLNGQGDYAPLKNVLDIMPMETDTIEFAATESGDWFFHCHILYHMMSGMGRIFSYENSPANPEIPNPKKYLRKLYQDDRRLHPMLHASIESNGIDGEVMLANTRYFLESEWRLGWDSKMGYESESHIGKYFGRNQFLRAYIGWDFRYRKNGYYNPNDGQNIFGISNTKNDRQVACFGIQYLLPFHILSDFRVDNIGRFRIQLSREDIAITNRLRLGGMINSDLEYMVGARYILTKYFSLSTHYDSDMRYGAGITFNY